ncbi:hypothetical protein DHEL01_v211286 [Diaporthe helianthi]|uniref:Uncharacterized protein n=1 Tax=Diaporthe helianthi TaxID=158607 RepID=A0A2P5HJ80_DIAHE|nr:hypothetical protein DHEL01_v211286 [Diaporthe helianthi]
MQISTLATLAAFSTVALAKLHKWAVCADNLEQGYLGNGTPWGFGHNAYKYYELNSDATKCLCKYYKNRNTGNKKWDKCPDCYYDGIQCISNDWHMGGDEITYYCTKKCGANTSVVND